MALHEGLLYWLILVYILGLISFDEIMIRK
jgi:hypothetical protein